MKDQSCGKCRFFDPSEDKKTGLCRRYPSIPVAMLQTVMSQGLIGGQLQQQPGLATNVMGIFCTMKSNDIGCGEFKNED